MPSAENPDSKQKFAIYLVGGAVRDLALGIEPKDRDYLVTGATPNDMLALGYTQVGAAFPVFLHPITKDEYALARTERKTGDGYHGFEISTENSKTLNPTLLLKFVELGYDPNNSYPIQELVQAFQKINQ